jgi:hypothetical protein
MEGQRMSKHEYRAWWRFVLSGLFGAYLCWWLFFADQTVVEQAWEGVRDVMDLMFYVMIWVSYVHLRRRKGIAQDERDLAISGIAAQTALVALVLLVLLTPFIVGGDGREDEVVLKRDWLDFYTLACIAFAVWMEAAVTVFHHWRDRR